MNAVDTNVFVYALDADEPIKQPKAKDLLIDLAQQPVPTIILWQVAVELLNNLRRWELKGKITDLQVKQNFYSSLGTFPVQVPGISLIDKSFDFDARFSLSHWDCLLLAACKEAGVDTLYSEDLSPTTDYDGVRVINPFA